MTDYVADRLERAIARNRAALLHILAVLFMKAGLDEGGAETLPRHIWRSILLVLRPAESAARRLIVVAARDIAVTLRRRAPRPAPRIAARRVEPPVAGEAMTPGIVENRTITVSVVFPKAPRRGPKQKGPESRIYWRGRFLRPGETPWAEKPEAALAVSEPAFALADAARRFLPEPARRRPACEPRIRSLSGPYQPLPIAEPEPDPDGELPARSLCRRLVALKSALDDLPGHALRLARLSARRAFLARHGDLADAMRPAPLRRGHPPGHRKRPAHPVDDILAECHELAVEAARHDSS